MTMTASAAWLNSSFAAFDEGVTLAIHKLYELCGGWLTSVMEVISLLGKGGIFLIALSVFLLVIRRTRRFGTAMLIALALGAVVVNLWLKVMIARPRPYADVGSIYYSLWTIMGSHTESDFSFPSGHTNAAFAAMVPVFLMGKKGLQWLALLFAVLMGISRIYLVVHFPSDVLGGLITGSIAGIIGTAIALRIPFDSFWYGWELNDLFNRKNRVKGAHE